MGIEIVTKHLLDRVEAVNDRYVSMTFSSRNLMKCAMR